MTQQRCTACDFAVDHACQVKHRAVREQSAACRWWTPRQERRTFLVRLGEWLLQKGLKR